MANITVNAKYLKDEQGNIISPVISSDTIFSPLGTGYTNFILDTIYPIGSIYMSVNSTDPSTLFGGTWEQLKDRFLLGTGDTYIAGSIGGSSTKTIAKENIPSYTLYSASHTHTFKGTAASHSHTVRACGGYGDAVGQYIGYSSTKNQADKTLSTGSTSVTPSGTNTEATITVTSGGSGIALDVMNPYLAVYMWTRTA